MPSLFCHYFNLNYYFVSLSLSFRSAVLLCFCTCLFSFQSVEKAFIWTKLKIIGSQASLRDETQFSFETIKLDVHHAEMEVRHIGFVKVHKAASSTMSNIFYRFGKKRNLTFVFTRHPNYFSRTASITYPLIKPSKRIGYDILCNHGVFNKTLYSSILPKDCISCYR